MRSCSGRQLLVVNPTMPHKWVMPPREWLAKAWSSFQLT
jgi:hypothetical protein